LNSSIIYDNANDMKDKNPFGYDNKGGDGSAWMKLGMKIQGNLTGAQSLLLAASTTTTFVQENVNNSFSILSTFPRFEKKSPPLSSPPEESKGFPSSWTGIYRYVFVKNGYTLSSTAVE